MAFIPMYKIKCQTFTCHKGKVSGLQLLYLNKFYIHVCSTAATASVCLYTGGGEKRQTDRQIETRDRFNYEQKWIYFLAFTDICVNMRHPK